jgi:RimJ/RimL family protein N-acetyltransferase
MSCDRLSTRRTRLRPVVAADYAALFELETAPDVLHTWRLRGGTPTSLTEYEQGLWLGMTDQRIIERVSDGVAIGLVQLYNTDFRLGIGWFSIIVVPGLRGTGVAMEGLGLFLRHCFTEWSLRRVYFSSLEPNFAAFSSVVDRPGCSIYGTLINRTFLEGEPVSVIVGGVDAAPWVQHYGPILDRLSARSDSSTSDSSTSDSSTSDSSTSDSSTSEPEAT